MIGRLCRFLLIATLLATILTGCQAPWLGPKAGSGTQTPAPANPPTEPPETASEAPVTAEPNQPEGIAPLGPGGGGAFDVLAFSPRYVFAATDISGIFRSSDHGQRWEAANRGLYDYMVNDIAVNPVDPAVIYIATPGGVYKSADNADSWHLLENGFPPKQSDRYSTPIGAIAIDPRNPEVLFAGIGSIRQENLARGNGNLYKSTDGGASWAMLNIGDLAAAFYEIVVDPIDDTRVYAATSVGFFLSTDAGETWTQTASGQSRGLTVGLDREASKVILYRAAWTAGVDRSDDGGVTWYRLAGPDCPHGCNFYRIDIDPTDPKAQTVFVGDYGDWNDDQGLFITRDGGQTWNTINDVRDAGWLASDGIARVRSLGVNPYVPGELYYGNSMGVFRTQDQAHWQQVYSTRVGSSRGLPDRWRGRGNINNTQVNTKPMFHPKNPGEYLLGLADILIWKTADNGASWQNVRAPGNNDVRALVADPNDANFLTWFASTTAQQCCSGSLYKTADGGQSWLRASGLPNDRVLDVAINTLDPSLVYAATQNHGLYMSVNGGVSFAARNGIRTSSLPYESIYRVIADERNPGTLYVVVNSKRGGIFLSRDGGENWWKTGAYSNCYALAISPLDSRQLFAGCGLQLYSSQDAGESWTELFSGWQHPLYPGVQWSGAYIRDIAVHPVNPEVLCFVIKDDPYHDQASGGGLHCSLDGGSTWRELAGPLGLHLRGTAVAFAPLADPTTGGHDLFYMTGGNGAFRIPYEVFLKAMESTQPE